MEIKFFGAVGEVTGSCWMIIHQGKRVLFDCGLIQGAPQDEARNISFDFDPKSIEAVVLSHAHLDHSGRIPMLIKKGFKGPVYTHPATKDLCKIMLKDSGHLQEMDVKWDNIKLERKGKPLIEPLYTAEEGEKSVGSFRPIPYGKKKEIIKDLFVTLHDAGHILGSAIVEVDVIDKGRERKIVFSGDLGHVGAPLLQSPTSLSEADLVIMESTYGDRDHRSWADTWSEMADVIKSANRMRGNILIPAFAVGRTQELLYTFRDHFKDWGLDKWTLFLDSPMAIDVTAVYRKYDDLFDDEACALFKSEKAEPFKLPNLYLTKKSNQSVNLNKIRSGAIIVAGSGMCNGGRIKHHLKHNIWRKGCHVIMVGFQARGTLGRALVDGAKTIRLWGEEIRVEAKVHTIGGLSAHADQSGLSQWYGHFKNKPPVVLVHGEKNVIKEFATHLRKKFKNTVIEGEKKTVIKFD